jgi:predicted enzyme related to lactoylglutathione lyase
MMRLGGKDVAAISTQPQQQRDAGVPPLWNSYVTVESADESLARAKQLGATVHADAFNVMEVGRMGVVQDPQGAYFLLWEPKAHIGASLVNAPGALCWNELATPDIEASSRFYSELFGWTLEPMEGMEMPYSIIKTAAATPTAGSAGSCPMSRRTGSCTSEPTTSIRRRRRSRSSAAPSWPDRSRPAPVG